MKPEVNQKLLASSLLLVFFFFPSLFLSVPFIFFFFLSFVFFFFLSGPLMSTSIARRIPGGHGCLGFDIFLMNESRPSLSQFAHRKVMNPGPRYGLPGWYIPVLSRSTRVPESNKLYYEVVFALLSFVHITQVRSRRLMG